MEEITTSYDQSVPLVKGSKDFIASMYKDYNAFYEKKDVEGLITLLQQVHDMQRLSGIALANFLYWMEKDWDNWKISDSFIDFIFNYIGKTKTTIDRYVAIGRAFSEKLIPEEYVEKISAMPLKNLVPIAKTIEQGYEISKDDWEDLASSPDDNAVRKVVRGIKNQPPRKHSLILMLDSDGDITALFGDDATPLYIGYLNINAEDEQTQQAIKRILDNSGIVKRHYG